MVVHRFHSTFNAVNFTNAVAGNYVSALLKYSRMNSERVRYHSYFSIGLIAVQALLCLYVLTEPEKIQDKEQSLAVITMESLGAFCTVYLLANSHRMMRVIEQTVALLLAFEEDGDGDGDFEKYLRDRSWPADLYGSISCAVMVALPVVDSLMKLIDGWRASTGFARNLNYHLPYEPKTTPAFEAVLMSESLCMVYSCAKPAGINHLFLTLFTLLSAFYSRLSYQLRNVFIQDRSHSLADRAPTGIHTLPVAEENFKKWIRIHQQIISVGNEVIAVYSPVLLVFQTNLFGSMVMVVFSATQNANNHSTGELIIFLLYSSLTLLNFFAVCLAANKLAEESESVKWAAYDTQWYDQCGTKVSCSYVKVMMTRANVPQVVTCFSSTAFMLSNATFITVVKSIASFYIALGQMRGKI